jgi:hypothetical protein
MIALKNSQTLHLKHKVIGKKPRKTTEFTLFSESKQLPFFKHKCLKDV